MNLVAALQNRTIYHHKRERERNRTAQESLLVFGAHARHPRTTVTLHLVASQHKTRQTHRDRVVVEKFGSSIERPMFWVQMN